MFEASASGGLLTPTIMHVIMWVPSHREATMGTPEETVKISVGIDAEFANTRYEDIYDTGITRSEWETKTDEERHAIAEEFRRDVLTDQINSWAQVVA